MIVVPPDPNLRYVMVNEKAGRALYYMFTPAKANPSSAPLILWLNGESE